MGEALRELARVTQFDAGLAHVWRRHLTSVDGLLNDFNRELVCLSGRADLR